MPNEWIFSASALAALWPAALVSYGAAPRGATPHEGGTGRGAVYWAAIAVAVAGPVSWTFVQFAGGWRTGLAMALWMTISVTMVIFAGLAALTRQSFRLTGLLLPYLFLLGVFATLSSHAPERPFLGTAPGGWIGLHIVVSVLTYALLTLAAVAGLAVFLQDRALKHKRPTALTRALPSVADGEYLQVRLLLASEAVLGIGLLSGMAIQFYETGAILEFTHKIVFALLAFFVIAGLLIVHSRFGLGGRRMARTVLVAYLLLSLGYPGVKFVTDVLLA